MHGITLLFFVHENQRHHGILLHEWLLEQAKAFGLPGGSAFRSIAGFGRHGTLHEESFFELAGDQPVAVLFMADEKRLDAFLERIRQENLTLFHVKLPVEFGILGKS
ncbi:MAG: DUF190 domain-containing protein [Magnetococcales bacterium]|nr:DUF190 domain-containing protein [Magnetococcales bacterium]